MRCTAALLSVVAAQGALLAASTLQSCLDTGTNGVPLQCASKLFLLLSVQVRVHGNQRHRSPGGPLALSAPCAERRERHVVHANVPHGHRGWGGR